MIDDSIKPPKDAPSKPEALAKNAPTNGFVQTQTQLATIEQELFQIRVARYPKRLLRQIIKKDAGKNGKPAS